MRERRYDADWLRIFAIMAIFIYHCTRFFDTEGWHLKNSGQSEILFISMRGLIWPWVMELFFLLAGLGASYSLQYRGAGSFLKERVKRLLIPFYTVGLIVLLPIQLYFELRTNAAYTSSFWQFIPDYLSRIGLSNFSQIGLIRFITYPENFLPIPFSGHLWFIQYLFLISLLTLPVLLYIKTERGMGFIRKIAEWSSKPGGIFIFVIPLSMVLIMFRGLFNASRSWADLIWYAVFFIIGYIIPFDKRVTDSINKHTRICLAIWISGFCGIVMLVFFYGYKPLPGKDYFTVPYLLFQILWSAMSWSAVVFFLGIGARYLTMNTKLLRYGNEAVLPFYLFHQTIILCVGWYILPLNMSIAAKFVITAFISFPLIVILYELFVRHFSVMRFFLMAGSGIGTAERSASL